MASRKLVRDLFLSKQPLFRNLLEPHQGLSRYTRLGLIPPNGHSFRRQFGVFNDFSKKIKGEVERNQDFQHSIKELKGKAEELKGVKEDLKVRTKQTSEMLYKSVDGVLTEAEVKAKKVLQDVEGKISAAKVEVKETFGIGKQESPGSKSDSANQNSRAKDGSGSAFREEKQQGHKQESESSETVETIFSKVKSGISSFSPKVSSAFGKLKEAKPVDFMKKGYDIVKEELKGNPNRRKRLVYDAAAAASAPKVEKSTRTEVVVVPSKQSAWSKKWEAFKEKMQGHPIFKRVSGISEPVVGKSQEIAEDMREMWETSDNPVVHKIQDLGETVLGESDAAMSFKLIRQRDPTFSLPEFVAEVQEVIKPVLKAYSEGDVEVLSKYCTPQVIERCKAEHKASEIQGIFYDMKILHVSEVDVFSTKMMEESPIIVVRFQTQEVFCVRDRDGSITEGGEDAIQTVHYMWAMMQLDPEELGEGAPYSIWQLRDMQRQGIRALI